MTVIEDFLESESEKTVVFLRYILNPRFRMFLQPFLSLPDEFSYDFFRQGIGKPPCYEYERSILLPVGEVGLVF